MAILVYDVTEKVLNILKNSFDNLDKWVTRIKENVDNNCIILVLGNKIDLADK